MMVKIFLFLHVKTLPQKDMQILFFVKTRETGAFFFSHKNTMTPSWNQETRIYTNTRHSQEINVTTTKKMDTTKCATFFAMLVFLKLLGPFKAFKFYSKLLLWG